LTNPLAAVIIKPMKTLLSVLFLFALLFSQGCSRAAPQIVFYSMNLVYYQNGAGYDSMFSFFVLPEDPDGLDDIIELRLTHEYEGLLWVLTPSDWVTYVDGEKTWVGSYSLATRDGESLPSGQFKARLTDSGGEKTERTIGFDVPAEHRYPFPKLTVASGEYHIICEYPELSFICYNAEGAYVRTIPVTARDGPISNLGLSNSISTVALWARDGERNTSALTDVVWVK
jgi:hypothetical protein